MTTLTASPAWRALEANYAQNKDTHLRTLFAKDPGRAEPVLTHDSSSNALIARFQNTPAQRASLAS